MFLIALKDFQVAEMPPELDLYFVMSADLESGSNLHQDLYGHGIEYCSCYDC